MPPMRVERGPAQQHGAAGGRGRGVMGIVHPGEGIEQLEEEHEGRHQRALRRALAAQLHHLGDQVEPGLLLGDQGGEVQGVVHDVGVGQQQQFGIAGGDALRHRPELAAPARRPGRAVDHVQAGVIDGAGQRAGAVGAAVVHQEQAQPARIVLGQQRAQGGGHALSLVPGRDHHVERRGLAEPRGMQHGAGGPETAMRQQQVEPGEQGHSGENGHARRPRRRNQAMASANAWRGGRAV